MPLYKILTVLFLFIYPNLAVTQSNIGFLEGNVLNADNGKPFENVNVVIKLDGQLYNATSTNDKGFYKFSRDLNSPGLEANKYEISLGIKGIGNIPVGDVEIKKDEKVTFNIMVGKDFLFADSDPFPGLNTESYDFIK